MTHSNENELLPNNINESHKHNVEQKKTKESRQYINSFIWILKTNKINIWRLKQWECFSFREVETRGGEKEWF